MIDDPYFGYGSNLDAEDWAAFCARRGFDPGCIRPLGPAVLADERLVFHYFSEARGGGALDIAPEEGSRVDGWLYACDEAGLAALDRKEGHPARYARERVTVLRPDGTRTRAFTYRVTPAHRRDAFVAPSADYLAICLRGRRALGLETATLERAARGF